MTGIRNDKSWEKQLWFDLDNGFEICIEYSIHYGEYASRINFPTRQFTNSGKDYWHCSNRLNELPDFVKYWVEEIKNAQGVIARLVRPLFESK